MKKKALILYSGGKDSHLALLTAIKKGYDPILWYMDGGAKRHIFFSNYIGPDIVKAHAEMAGFKLFTIKMANHEPVKIARKIIRETINMLNEGEELVYFSSNDYQETKKDKKFNKQLRDICKDSGIKFISFLDIIKKDDVSLPIKMCIEKGIKSIVIGLEREIDKNWLLKSVDLSFAKMLIKDLKSGKNIDGNSYQSLVLESPLFGNKKMKILATDYAYDSKDMRHFSIIKKFSIVKK